ncbi:FAD-dependent monooxygenase [Williamsia phyllosphaerae]|uniref:3-(3-hydroxyphenyl)propionate hydroxylase n=1 Tax=Williamsia phyllosphaerae TaxID=885042 RepID=A0ABQ1UIP2_9NOCA|nr:FAD-dependent monooxygenase [Williamsia phyllosphaerae]GGF18812.1 3-(3-hydroxyphenyl)propionate hydroxylase [Williamsia phyllosphaerae]
MTTGHTGAAAAAPNREVDVIIVGLGPTGATAANLLGQRGISTLVVERDDTIYPRQRAIASDEDAHRVWQNLGLFDEMLATMSSDIRVHFKHGNRTFMSMQGNESRGQGVPGTAFYHQPELERVLRQGIRRFPMVDTVVGMEAVGLTQDEDSVTVTLRPINGEPEQTVTGRYVIACDGGSSSIRKLSGIGLPGRHIEEQWFDIQLRAWYDLPTNAPLDFTFISDPARPGVDCPCPMGYHRVEYRVNKGETVEQLQTEAGLRGLLAERGIDYDNVEIFRSWGYTFHIRQAERWRDRRVFLAGDAAHIMPPFAGQGVSSGVRDVANLCWKIDAVLNARAGEDLLDSYEPERRPNVEQLTRFSLTIGGAVMLGSRVASHLRDAVFMAATKIPLLGNWLTGIGPKPLYRLGTAGGFFADTRRGRRRSLRGDFIKQPWVSGANHTPVRLDTVLDNRWAWVGFPESPIPQALANAGVAEIKLDYASAIADHNVAAGRHVDTERMLERQLRHGRVHAVLVRPDRFIYAGDRELSRSDIDRVAAAVVTDLPLTAQAS